MFDFAVKKIKCLTGNHEYEITRQVSEHIFELRCIRCGKEFVVNTNMFICLKLNDKLKRANDDFEKIYRNIKEMMNDAMNEKQKEIC